MAVPGIKNWQATLLKMVGAPVTPANINYMNAWARAEGGSATNNPFNTTQPGFGATGNYNSVGVKNYSDPMQGLQATAHTLLNGRYGGILSALKQGNNAMAAAQALAASPWGTGGLVEKILGGGGPVTAPTVPAGSKVAPMVSGAQGGNGAAPGGSMNPIATMLLQAASHGGQIDPGSLLGAAMQRQALGAAQQTFGPPGSTPQPANVKPSATVQVAPYKGKFKFLGNYGQEDPTFINHLAAAAAAAGATQIRVNSGERSVEHNAAIGGASHSNHLPDARGFGHAMDGEGYVPGKGWVPLGTLLMPIASKYGLRSGATFQWGGHPDYVHVDDGYNQH